MIQATKLLHTARTSTTWGSENGVSRSLDGLLDVRLATPGSARIGSNPEQLFAAAWSASLASAIALAAKKRKVSFHADLTIDAEVDLCVADGACFLRARLTIRLPDVAHDVARALVDEAREACPYCKMTRGSIEAAISVV